MFNTQQPTAIFKVQTGFGVYAIEAPFYAEAKRRANKKAMEAYADYTAHSKEIASLI
jgi:hypothetical protein